MAALVGEVPEEEAWAAGLWVAAGWEVVELEAVATAVAGTGVVVAEAWMALAAAGHRQATLLARSDSRWCSPRPPCRQGS